MGTVNVINVKLCVVVVYQLLNFTHGMVVKYIHGLDHTYNAIFDFAMYSTPREIIGAFS